MSEEQRAPFSFAQEQWARLASLPGFVLQAGGWDRSEPECAAILSLWADFESYSQFMTHHHDPIFNASGQASTYKRCRTSQFEDVFPMNGSGMKGTGTSFIEKSKGCEVLRAASCLLLPNRTEHFLKVQREIWAPSMERRGMCAGLVCRCSDSTESDRFLILSLWQSAEAHDRYRREAVTELRHQAQVESDVAVLRGRCISLEPRWHVGSTL